MKPASAQKPLEIAQPKSTRPVNDLLELVGQRWTLRILWELRDGPQTFRALQLRCGNLSPSIVNSRIQSLREADIVELTVSGYALTALGLELGAKLLELTRWADRWAKKRRTPGEAP